MRVYPEMTCCKPGRQQVGLQCDAGWMACCLSQRCAKLPTLNDRRVFASQVAQVQLIVEAGLVDWFRTEVHRLYKARKTDA